MVEGIVGSSHPSTRFDHVGHSTKESNLFDGRSVSESSGQIINLYVHL